MKSVFEYENYRDFMRDYYLDAKMRDKKFSFRYFSRKAGFKSSSTLKMIIDGQRRIHPRRVEQVAKAMKLSRNEATFFRNLVLFNQAATSERKQHYAQQILRSRVYRQIHPLHDSQYNVYAHWYLLAIRELVNLSGFKEDPAWIGRQIAPPITPKEARAAVDDLLALDLLRRDSRGRLVQTNKSISTGDAITSASVAKYHRDMMKRAMESIDRTPREKRELTALTVGVSSRTAQKIKEMIHAFREDIAEVVAADETPDSIYQIHLHLFPIAEVKDGEGPKE